MKISLINPPVYPYRKIMRNFDCATESKGNYLYQPYDFLLMTGKVPTHWAIQFIDAIASNFDQKNTLREIKLFKPDIIVCAIAATNWSQDFNFIKLLRETFPLNFLFVFGDALVENQAANEINPFVNGILTSPVMVDFSIFESIQNPKSFISVEITGFRNSDFYLKTDLKTPIQFTLKNIRHDLISHSSYRWPFAHYYKYTTIFTAWGCPYSCSYCILNKFPNYWRNFQEIIDEMIQIKKSGYKEIYIGDRSFGLPLVNVKKLLNEMIDKKFNFSWSTYFHPNQYTPELLELMKESGCHTIIVGIESKNLKSLKKFGRHVNESNFLSLINHAKKLNINICGDFILGLPGENKNDIEESIKYSMDLEISYASFNIAAPLAGSNIRSLAIENGQMLESDKEIDSFGRSRIISVCEVNEAELRQLRNMAILKFYLRPGYLIKRLINTSGIEHFVIQFQEAVLIFSKLIGLK